MHSPVQSLGEYLAFMIAQDLGLITSQDDTAPKPASMPLNRLMCLITSQDDTAPKPHEYYGHRRFRKTKLPYGDWRDEFRASYRAALDTPNLTDEERRSHMVDAYNRASEGGAALRYTDDYRRIVYGYEKR